jgi:hypothetical protein
VCRPPSTCAALCDHLHLRKRVDELPVPAESRDTAEWRPLAELRPRYRRYTVNRCCGAAVGDASGSPKSKNR